MLGVQEYLELEIYFARVRETNCLKFLSRLVAKTNTGCDPSWINPVVARCTEAKERNYPESGTSSFSLSGGPLFLLVALFCYYGSVDWTDMGPRMFLKRKRKIGCYLEIHGILPSLLVLISKFSLSVYLKS